MEEFKICYMLVRLSALHLDSPEFECIKHIYKVLYNAIKQIRLFSTLRIYFPCFWAFIDQFWN